MGFARHVFAGDGPRSLPWWESVCTELEEGKGQDVLAQPEVMSYRDKDATERICNSYRRLCDNRDAIDYPSFRRRGLIVDSTAIEGGSLIAMLARMASLSWHEESAEGVRALCTARGSGLWDEHVVPLVREHYRTHQYVPGNVREAQRTAHKRAKGTTWPQDDVHTIFKQ